MTKGFRRLKAAISNRNFSRLENSVSHRKHSPDPKSNRNFRSTSFQASHAFSGVRKVAQTTCRWIRGNPGIRFTTEECQWHSKCVVTIPASPATTLTCTSPHRSGRSQSWLCDSIYSIYLLARTQRRSRATSPCPQPFSVFSVKCSTSLTSAFHSNH